MVGIGLVVIGVVALSVVSVGALAQQDTHTITETQPNDDRANATSVESGTVIHGTLDPVDDIDYYAIEADAGDNVVAEFQRPGDEADYPASVVIAEAGLKDILNPPGATVSSGSTEYNTGGVALQNDTYFVGVSSAFREGTGNYTLTIRTFAGDAYEPNNFDQNATPNPDQNVSSIGSALIEPNTTLNATLAAGDIDGYRFNATAGDRIDVTLTRSAESANNTIGVGVGDARLAPAQRGDSAGLEPGETRADLSFVTNYTGTHNVNVDARSVDTIGLHPYTLTVTVSGSETGGTNESATSTTTPPSDEDEGTHQSDGTVTGGNGKSKMGAGGHEGDGGTANGGNGKSKAS